MITEDVTKKEADQAEAENIKLSKSGKAKFNQVAIVTMPLCLVFPPAALFSGIQALLQIKKSGERGSLLAIIGVIWGLGWTLFWVGFAIYWEW
jgi:hypothetical protein